MHSFKPKPQNLLFFSYDWVESPLNPETGTDFIIAGEEATRSSRLRPLKSCLQHEYRLSFWNIAMTVPRERASRGPSS